MSESFSRKDFFKSLPRQILGDVKPKRKIKKKEIEEKQIIFRPPGAIADDVVFLKTCKTGCRACAEACQHDAIIFTKIGKSKKSPVLSFEEKPCRWCQDFPCVAACPTDALVLGEIKPLGRAVINMELCSTTQGMLCDICYSVCPSSVRAIQMDQQRKPLINEEKCTGCGMCAYYCDMSPSAIRIEKI